MAKTAVKKQKHKQRSDIPYSERMLREKEKNIYFHRDDAARVVLMLAMVALNDTEHMGYKRLLRFAQHLMPLVHEYYADRERMHEHVKRRLESIGFVVRGNEVFPKEVWEEIKSDQIQNGQG